MIVLDTAVVAELLRGPRADPVVLGWVQALDEQPVTTVVNRAELLAGVGLLDDEARRTLLAGAVEDLLADLSVCLPFTGDCAAAYADVVATRTRAGQPVATRVALVAAIARVHDAAIATPDLPSYDGLDLRLADPWAT